MINHQHSLVRQQSMPTGLKNMKDKVFGTTTVVYNAVFLHNLPPCKQKGTLEEKGCPTTTLEIHNNVKSSETVWGNINTRYSCNDWKYQINSRQDHNQPASLCEQNNELTQSQGTYCSTTQHKFNNTISSNCKRRMPKCKCSQVVCKV